MRINVEEEHAGWKIAMSIDTHTHPVECPHDSCSLWQSLHFPKFPFVDFDWANWPWKNLKQRTNDYTLYYEQLTGNIASLEVSWEFELLLWSVCC